MQRMHKNKNYYWKICGLNSSLYYTNLMANHCQECNCCFINSNYILLTSPNMQTKARCPVLRLQEKIKITITPILTFLSFCSLPIVLVLMWLPSHILQCIRHTFLVQRRQLKTKPIFFNILHKLWSLASFICNSWAQHYHTNLLCWSGSWYLWDQAQWLFHNVQGLSQNPFSYKQHYPTPSLPETIE